MNGVRLLCTWRNKGANIQQKHMFCRYASLGTCLSLIDVHDMKSNIIPEKGNKATNCLMAEDIALHQVHFVTWHTAWHRKATEIAPLRSLRERIWEEMPTLAQRVCPFSPGRSSARCSIPSKHKNINKTKTTTSDKTMLNSSVPPTTKRWLWWQIGSHVQPLYPCCHPSVTSDAKETTWFMPFSTSF